MKISMTFCTETFELQLLNCEKGENKAFSYHTELYMGDVLVTYNGGLPTWNDVDRCRDMAKVFILNREPTEEEDQAFDALNKQLNGE